MLALREHLLCGRTIALAGAVRPELADVLAGLGGSVQALDPRRLSGLDGTEAEEWVRERAPMAAVIHDARAAFGDGGQEGLSAALEQAWAAVAAVANGALIPADAGGKVVLIAPRPNAGPYAEATRSALENLARTLSVEWARFGITTTAIAPGMRTTEDEVAALVAFLISPAGDYFSGCRFELGVSPAPLIRAS
jgi:NAD(P)-dependent dehydrogenase (short-subunit alcohol dehydrogenase family)